MRIDSTSWRIRCSSTVENRPAKTSATAPMSSEKRIRRLWIAEISSARSLSCSQSCTAPIVAPRLVTGME